MTSRENDLLVEFLMVIMANGITRGRVLKTTATESRNMAAKLQCW